MSNSALLANAVFACPSTAAVWWLGYHELAAAIALVPLTLGAGLVMSWRGYTMASRIWSAVVQVVICLLVALLGSRQLVVAVPVMLVLLPFSVFSTRQRLALGICVVAALMAAVMIYVPGLLPEPLIPLPESTLATAQQVISLGVLASVLLMTYTNAAARDQAARALKRARKQAEKADQIKSSVLADISHEIRTPLGAIEGFVRMLRDPRATDDRKEQATDAISRNSAHMLELVNSVLDLSKIEAGELIVNPTTMELTELIEQVASLVRAKAHAKNLAFSIDYRGKLPMMVTTDPLRLRQVLVNLISNAIKFTEEGSVTLRLELGKSARELLITVIDTGVGIAPEITESVFKPYVRADTTTARLSGGSGLGLAIAQRLARLLGARIELRSELGKGSAFTVRLPLESTDSDDLELAPAPEKRRRRRTPAKPLPRIMGLRALLAEDSADNATLLKYHLEHAGMQLVWVEDGLQAVEAVASNEDFDVVIMDIQMPRLDGCEVTRQLRDAGHTVPVIALTAHAMAGDRERCMEAGCNHYLTKPVNVAELIQVISELTPSGQAKPQPEAATSPSPEDKPSDDLATKLEALTARFVASLPGKVASLRAAMDSDDSALLAREAHKLAGSGGSYGCNAVGSAAAALERAAADGADGEQLAQLLDQLDQEVQSAPTKVSR